MRRPTSPLAVIVAGLLLAGCADAAGESDAFVAPEPAPAPRGTAAPDADNVGFASVVDDVLPAVVSIRRDAGEGSGVIWDAAGVIVTNAHVVRHVEQITVVFADGTSMNGNVVATDPVADLAVVRVQRDGLPVISVSEELPEIGDRALAIGSPLGFDHTVTSGIVSGLHRSIPAGGSALVDLVQTDAPISPGNSGGALVNGDGELIGINVAYIAPQAGAVSLGFAIPAPTVVDTVEELLEDGTADHPYLGIRPAPLSAEVAERFDLSVERGVLVLDVIDQGPAAAAGLERGHVIIALDGEDIDGIEDLFTQLRDRDPGDRVTLTVARDDGTEEVDVLLADWPDGQ